MKQFNLLLNTCLGKTFSSKYTAARHPKTGRGSLLFLMLLLVVPALFLQSGCAKNPAATAPINGKQTASKTKGSDVVETARAMMGTKYKYGGTTPDRGFDCSGFICWTYSKHGKALPRTAKEQAKAGAHVQKTELQPGDIVVFKMSSRRNLYHCGIYVGEGKFIHSPRTGKTIREDSLSSNYWSKRIIATRRILT